MLKRVLSVLMVATCGPVFAQNIEPGEWEFNAVTSSPLFPGGQSMVFRRCITKEQADNPEAWMVRQNETADCKLTPGEKTPSSMKWEVFCPKTNMRGNGVARVTSPGQVESELRMTSEFQGYRVQMNTRTTGRRLGPCKT